MEQFVRTVSRAAGNRKAAPHDPALAGAEQASSFSMRWLRIIRLRITRGDYCQQVAGFLASLKAAGSGHSFRAAGGELDDKARALRFVVLDPDSALVVGDDVADYCQSQARAPVAR